MPNQPCHNPTILQQMWNHSATFYCCLLIIKLHVGVSSGSRVGSQLAKDIDIHVITGLLKLYLRELPESLFTDSLYPNFVTGMGIISVCFTGMLTWPEASRPRPSKIVLETFQIQWIYACLIRKCLHFLQRCPSDLNASLTFPRLRPETSRPISSEIVFETSPDSDPVVL